MGGLDVDLEAELAVDVAEHVLQETLEGVVAALELRLATSLLVEPEQLEPQRAVL